MRQRLDAAYADKLDGKISGEFWTRTPNGRQNEQQIQLAIQALEQVRPERLVDAVRILRTRGWSRHAFSIR